MGLQDDSKVDYPTFQWKFRVRCIAGVEPTSRAIAGVSLSPWWLPPLTPTNPATIDNGEGTLAASEALNQLTTPLLYLQAQETHPNYPLQDLLSRDASAPLVPNALLVELRSCQSDETFPTGWLCPACGKINFQLAMRHRQCSGSACLKISQKVSQASFQILPKLILRRPRCHLSLWLASLLTFAGLTAGHQSAYRSMSIRRGLRKRHIRRGRTG